LARGYFQQDEATAYTARETLRYLQEFFDDRLICRELWRARTPDLTPLDYYLFSHVKNTAFKALVHTIDDFKIKIGEEYERVCIEAQGFYFQHLF
jgi:hypothetical protein